MSPPRSPSNRLLLGGVDRAGRSGLLGVDARSNDAGGLVLSIPPTGALLLRADTQLPVARPSPPTLKTSVDDLTELVRVTATTSAKTVSVAFALHRATGGWRRLAADDSPPYRCLSRPEVVSSQGNRPPRRDRACT